ncbi:MAG: GNAT family N-acetyltransferase [Candidatus Eremiobacteraeota bacterium]|nr:GNAT family N-acetyltransferase [Candidatus Eremiobacteraeota bacterium]
MTVRTAREDDLEEIGEVDASLVLHPRRLERLRAAIARGQLLVAETDGHVAGLMDYHDLFFGHTFVALVVVHPQQRRRRIATRLLDEAAARARTDRLFVSTVASHPIMHTLLEKRGFVRCGAVEQIDPGETEVFYVRLLGDASTASPP